MDIVLATGVMRPGYSKVRSCVAVLLGACTWLTPAGAATPLVDQKITTVLDELKGQGLTFIYNSELVPGGLTVLAEPRARSGIELVREILKPHKLTVNQVVPGVFSVMKLVVPPAPAIGADLAPVRETAPSEEVVVNSSRYRFMADGTAHAFLTQDQLQDMPHLADEPLRAVQRLPGVASNGFSALGQIRGGATNETSIVLDGLRLYEPFHLRNFQSPVSVLDSRVVDSIEVYAGGFPAVHGGSMSGVLEVSSVSPNRPWYYETALSLFHASGLASAQFAGGRGEAMFSLRRSNAGLLAHAAESDFGTPNYSDGFAKLSYQLDAVTRGSLQVLLSNDRISVRRDSATQQAKAEYRNAYTWATLSRDWSQHSTSRIILSVNDASSARLGTIDRPGRRTGQVDDDREFRIVGLQLDNRFNTGSIEHRFGGAPQYVAGKYGYASVSSYAAGFPFPDSPSLEMVRSTRATPNGLASSAYWDARGRLGERLTIEAGARFDRQTYGDADGTGQFSPRLSVLHEVGPRTRLRASWGRYYQAQGVNELQVEDGLSRFNPPQYADHMIFSLDHDFNSILKLRIESYRKEYRRLSPRFENVFNPLVLLPELEFDRVRLDPSRARAEGVEVLIKLEPIGRWGAWLGYTHSRVADRIDNRDVRRSWDQRDALSAGLSFSSAAWSIGAAYTYHTGWPMTGVDIVPAVDEGERAVIGLRNAQQFRDFNSLDVRVTRAFPLSRGVLDVFVEVTNALSQTNPCCTEYVVRRDDRGLNVRADTDDWLPLVPSAGVLWRF